MKYLRQLLPSCLALTVISSLLLGRFASASPITDEATGNLVALQGKSVKKFDVTTLSSSKFIAIYFSASWCGPCRKFTPELVRWYKANKPKHANFELIFVSSDHSEEDMEAYMKADDMPWPALDFSKKKSSNAITSLAGRGIPCLVVVDDTGKVVSDSYEGQNYVGPNKVLQDLEKLLAANPASANSSSAPATAGKVGSGSFDIFEGRRQ